MTSLFLDTTSGLTVGILDNEYQWIDYVALDEKRCANSIHSRIDQLLGKNGIGFDAISAIFYLAGPGSYTGMRAAEGVAAIANWHGVAIHPFYHFEVPGIVIDSEDQGAWLAFAFKQEFFLYRWNNSKGESALMKQEELSAWMATNCNIPVYLRSESAKGVDTTDLKVEIAGTTNALIKDYSQKLFPALIKYGRDVDSTPLHYYRPLEQEFLVPGKEMKK